MRRVLSVAYLAVSMLVSACTDREPLPTAAPANSLRQNAGDGTVLAASLENATSARIEVYRDGALQRVVNATPDQAYTSVTPAVNKQQIDEKLERLDKSAPNSRTKIFTKELRKFYKAAEKDRGKAFDAMSKSLLRQIKHKATTQGDGSRLVEYQFDQHSTIRVWIPAGVVAATKRSNTAMTVNEGEPRIIAMEEGGEDECSFEECLYTQEYLDYLYTSLSFMIDQIEMMEAEAFEYDTAEAYVTFKPMCLFEMARFSAAVALTGYGARLLRTGWAALNAEARVVGFLAEADQFFDVIDAWNALHNCFHPWG